MAVEPCPRLQPGAGRLVLTTVNHLNNNVWELSAVDRQGRQEELRPTGLHKFYSESRHDWVSAKDVHDNEVIRGRAGPLTIVDARPLTGTQRVYNLTVEGEHVYYVSNLALLAHNTCAGKTGPRNLVYQLVDDEGIPVYYGTAEGPENLAARLRSHARTKAGLFKGQQVIAEDLTRSEALSLETSLIDVARKSGRSLLNKSRSIREPIEPIVSTFDPTVTHLPPSYFRNK